MKRINNLLFWILGHINLSKHITNHLVGEDHSPRHQKITGLFIIMFGVAISKLSLLLNTHVVHFIGDAVGYAIHGIGLIPFAKDIEHTKPH